MSKRIAFLGKYYPIEGGNVAGTYWLARGLAKRGHEVHIITDAWEAAGSYQITNESEPAEILPNFFVHRPEHEIPWHIPEYDEQPLALLDLTLDVIVKHNIEILDTGYLAPYGMVGHVAQRITGVKHVVRHGVSDVEDFLKKGLLRTILQGTIKSADAVVTDGRYADIFKPLNGNTHVLHPYVVDTGSFVLPYAGGERKHLAAAGKINYYWDRKGLRQICDLMHNLVDDFDCTLVHQGIGLEEIQKWLGKNTIREFNWPGFIAPWDMPRFLSGLDALFVFKKPEPHSPVSSLAMEALCAGVGIITNDAEFSKPYEDIISINEGQVFLIDPEEIFSTTSALKRWLADKWVRKPATQKKSFSDYIAAREKIYESLGDTYLLNMDVYK